MDLETATKVQEDVYDTFAAKLTKRVASFVVGHGSESETTIGPLINRAGFEKARDHCDDAIAKGATRNRTGTYKQHERKRRSHFERFFLCFGHQRLFWTAACYCTTIQ